MTEPWLGVVEKVAEFFASAQIEACARRTGFVRRTSKLTGKVFVALVTLGTWGTAKTSLAQLAAKAAQLPTPVDISSEALPQRMTRRAVVFLQALLQRAFTTLHTGLSSCDTELFTPFTAVHIADSTGFALPPTLKPLFPGSGGGASLAGAKVQLVWVTAQRGQIIWQRAVEKSVATEQGLVVYRLPPYKPPSNSPVRHGAVVVRWRWR